MPAFLPPLLRRTDIASSSSSPEGPDSLCLLHRFNRRSPDVFASPPLFFPSLVSALKLVRFLARLQSVESHF